MNQNLKPEERELIKLVGFFKKKAVRMMEEKTVDEGYDQLIETCEKLVSQIELHAKNRGIVLGEREQLQNLVKDNAQCPKCISNTNLKLTGVEKNDKGWRSNKYKCRKCNVEFVWNAPNNPWDMIPYVEGFVADLEVKLVNENDDSLKQNTGDVLKLMKLNLSKLRPVVEASDLDFAELNERDNEMADMVHKFKKHLMIEKIRMED